MFPTRAARANGDWKRVVATGASSQATVMAMPPGSEIGAEIHADYDQIVQVVEGHGVVTVDCAREAVAPGDSVFIRGGQRHNVRNTDDTTLRLVVYYAPAKFAEGTVFAVKPDGHHAH